MIWECGGVFARPLHADHNDIHAGTCSESPGRDPLQDIYMMYPLCELTCVSQISSQFVGTHAQVGTPIKI